MGRRVGEIMEIVLIEIVIRAGTPPPFDVPD
jgi:hypothetical protein